MYAIEKKRNKNKNKKKKLIVDTKLRFYILAFFVNKILNRKENYAFRKLMKLDILIKLL